MRGDSLVYAFVFFILIVGILYLFFRRRRARKGSEAGKKRGDESVHELEVAKELELGDAKVVDSPVPIGPPIAIPLISGTMIEDEVPMKDEDKEDYEWLEKRDAYIKFKAKELRKTLRGSYIPAQVPPSYLDTVADEVHALGRKFDKTPEEMGEFAEQTLDKLEDVIAKMGLEQDDKEGCVIS